MVTEVKTLQEEGLHRLALQSTPKIVQSLTIMSIEKCLFPTIQTRIEDAEDLFAMADRVLERYHFLVSVSRNDMRWWDQRENGRLDEM